MLDTNQKEIKVKPEDIFDKKFTKITEAAEFHKFIEAPKDLWPPRLFVEGMLKWGGNMDLWAGPFKGNTCYASIIDYSCVIYLKTVDQLILEWKTREIYSAYSFPTSIREKLDKIFPKAMEIDTIAGSFLETYKDGSKATRTQLTQAELNLLKTSCTEEELNHYTNKVRHSTERFSITVPTVEAPVSLYMAGTDDVSFTIFYITIAEAVKDLIHFKRESDKFILEERGAVFTN